MNEHATPQAPPEFHPSAETELLCADVANDQNGRVFVHLLRQVDVAKQQNSHIIREQIEGSMGREKILSAFRDQTVEFRQHEQRDDLRFAALTVAQREMNDWRKTWFGRKGIGAIVLSALLFVGYDAVIKPLFVRHQATTPAAK